uniref:Uncharacterized protein n=1 Tax=Panagrolaimus sp. ES5 TaxID=591445 RepID=A0AC34FZ78_9BILA
MRFNLSRTEKELNKFYLISKIIRVRASKLKKERRINVQNDNDLDGSNADEDEEDSEEETDSDDDEENPNDPDYEPEQKEASADEIHVILKHTMPIRGKQMPVGFSTGSGAPIPIATMDFGTKEHRWALVSGVIPSLIELLSRSVLHFQKGATQTDPNEDFSALLKFCVMIFSRIFQSREIALECDHHDSNITTDLLTRRQKVVSAFNREINVFNSSIVPQGDITHNPFNTSSAMDQDDNDDSPIVFSETYLQGRISDNGRESVENNTNEANVIAFFIKTAKYVSTIECASAMLSLLKTFDDMDEHHRRLCAGTALHYLNKDWSDESEETSEALEERNALLIATNGFAVGTYKDSEEAVKEYEGKKFSCVDKIPQWHKLLFKQFNDNVFIFLKYYDSRTTTAFWSPLIECSSYGEISPAHILHRAFEDNIAQSPFAEQQGTFKKLPTMPDKEVVLDVARQLLHPESKHYFMLFFGRFDSFEDKPPLYDLPPLVIINSQIVRVMQVGIIRTTSDIWIFCCSPPNVDIVNLLAADTRNIRVRQGQSTSIIISNLFNLIQQVQSIGYISQEAKLGALCATVRYMHQQEMHNFFDRQ